MNDKKYKVYKHICPNGKVYIGISIHPEYRWNSGKGYKKSLFGKAIKKFGWENIEHVIAKGTYTQERACELEKKLIAKYKSNDKKFGYNVTGGGQGSSCLLHTDEYKEYMSDMFSGEGNPMYGKYVTQEHRDKIAKANSGRVFTEEHKKKIGLANKEKTGRQHTEEEKEKISKAHKGIKFTQEHKDAISKALKGKKKTQIHKDKLSNKILSQETKNKISASQKKRLALIKEGGDCVASH